MGSYHGKKSFDTFTHYRSIVKKATWLDLSMRYHPYNDSKFRMSEAASFAHRSQGQIRSTVPSQVSM